MEHKGIGLGGIIDDAYKFVKAKFLDYRQRTTDPWQSKDSRTFYRNQELASAEILHYMAKTLPKHSNHETAEATLRQWLKTRFDYYFKQANNLKLPESKQKVNQAKVVTYYNVLLYMGETFDALVVKK